MMGGGPGRKREQMLVILPFPEPTAIFDRIRKKHPHITITFKNLTFNETPWKGVQEIPREIYHDVTILVTLSALPPSPEDCPKLEFIHFFSAGSVGVVGNEKDAKQNSTNHIAKSPIYTSTKIPLTTSSGESSGEGFWQSKLIGSARSQAYMDLKSLNAHSHHYALLHSWQQQHNWGKGDNQGVLRTVQDRVGQRLAVLGYGSIGRQVARVAKAMGMDVIAYTASPRTTPSSKKDHGFVVPGTGDPDGSIPSAWFSGLDKESLHDFLAQDVDHLLVSVPLTKETTHFLAAPEFGILVKRNAFVTNISRGQILNQKDLITALEDFVQDGGQSGKGLRGAALDVTDPEPLPKEDPLWEAPNCIITPHISGLGTAYVDRAFQVLEVNLDRRERGEEMINVVDRDKGY